MSVILPSTRPHLTRRERRGLPEIERKLSELNLSWLNDEQCDAAQNEKLEAILNPPTVNHVWSLLYIFPGAILVFMSFSITDLATNLTLESGGILMILFALGSFLLWIGFKPLIRSVEYPFPSYDKPEWQYRDWEPYSAYNRSTIPQEVFEIAYCASRIPNSKLIVHYLFNSCYLVIEHTPGGQEWGMVPSQARYLIAWE